MLTVCWAAKGGSGTTVVSCALALLSARHHEAAWLLDLAGDVPAALGLPDPTGPGIHDWVDSSTAPPDALGAIGVVASDALRIVGRGSATAPLDHVRWAQLGQFLADRDEPTVVDAGTAAPPPQLLAAAHQRILVTRPCYLSLRRASATGIAPTGIVVVHEPGRALRSGDVAHALRTPVVAEVDSDPAVARAVDAGLLAARLPRTIVRALRELAR